MVNFLIFLAGFICGAACAVIVFEALYDKFISKVVSW